MTGDLHCHSRISDGSMGIDDLVVYAKRTGLDFIGITDHDTMAGVQRAQQLGKRYGIGVIAGAELSARDMARGRKVHLLCYLPKNPDRLEGFFKRATERRDRTTREIMAGIVRRFPITEEHILRYAAGSASVYKVHIMQALMDFGYADALYGKVFQELLAPGGSCYIPQEYEDVWETAQLIRSAGGVCVLAHPSVYDSLDLMEELAQAGAIDGVERQHPRATPDEQVRIDSVIEQYDLIAIGGSDFHGANQPHPRPIGTCVTERESLERIFRFAKGKP